MRKLLCAILFAAASLCVAQTTPSPSAVPDVEHSPAAQAALSLERWRESRVSVYMNDYGELAQYQEANVKLPPVGTRENRVIFFGDSITWGWHLDNYFPGKDYINRGISGQTTSQMLVRFHQDVINLHPKVVVVLAGTNDIAGNTGPVTVEQIEDNYASLAELARAHSVQIIFSSVTPIHNYFPERSSFFLQRSPQKIVELNHWLRQYCQVNGLIYLDYYSAMVDSNGMMRKDLANDGLHPNDAGYRIMAPLAEKAIEAALSK
jgi:lysophospholipase L1-like esterase